MSGKKGNTALSQKEAWPCGTLVHNEAELLAVKGTGRRHDWMGLLVPAKVVAT